MHALAILFPLIAANVFAANIDEAFTLVRNKQWAAAAIALDRAFSEDPSSFVANNLHYLRGRIAENQKDWSRALAEFEEIGPSNPLRPLAALHAARASINLQDVGHASTLLLELPPDFPAGLKMQLAREAPPVLAVKIYGSLTSRQARFERARLLGQSAVLWSLMRENNADDTGLEAARLLAPTVSTPRQVIDVANAFAAHRQFTEAIERYQQAAGDPQFAAEALFQTARAYFQQQDYRAALQQYELVAGRFEGSDWQKDAKYQIASCHWRLGDYPAAEKAYIHYIEQYSGKGVQESAVRNLVDVYRAAGDHANAIALVDRTLSKRLSTATRQTLLLSKAKILFAQKRYNNALSIFRQLGKSRLQTSPGGASKDEVQYFEALTLAKLGDKRTADAIWKRLAAGPPSYYGQQSSLRLGSPSRLGPVLETCGDLASDPALQSVTERLLSARRSVRSEIAPTTDAVSELVFMQLWDEASQWIDRIRKPNIQLAADLSYAAGRYDRAITYAGRLPESQRPTRALQYPAAYRPMICSAASSNRVDPLWLHAIIWQESKYNPNAASGASARGLMQFIPETAASVGATIGLSQIPLDRLYDPETSIRLGASYWASLMQEFKLPELALAAYNGGPENVRRWRDKWPDAEIEFFVSDIGFVETKRYVQAVFAARAAYSAAFRSP